MVDNLVDMRVGKLKLFLGIMKRTISSTDHTSRFSLIRAFLKHQLEELTSTIALRRWGLTGVEVDRHAEVSPGSEQVSTTTLGRRLGWSL